MAYLLGTINIFYSIRNPFEANENIAKLIENYNLSAAVGMFATISTEENKAKTTANFIAP